MSRGHGRRWSAAAGQAIVEFALITPLLLMLTVGLLDASRALFAYSALQNATAEGARKTIISLYSTSGPLQCLVGGTSGNTQPLVQAATSEASVLGLDTSYLSGASAPLTNANFSVAGYTGSTATLCPPSNGTVTFQATYTFHPLVSLMFGPGSTTMSAQTTMQIE